jgi:hypothetical protein
MRAWWRIYLGGPEFVWMPGIVTVATFFSRSTIGESSKLVVVVTKSHLSK